MLQTTFHLSERQDEVLKSWEKSLPISRDPTAASYELFFKFDFSPELTSGSLPIASAKCHISGKTLELGSVSSKQKSRLCAEFFLGDDGEVCKAAFWKLLLVMCL